MSEFVSPTSVLHRSHPLSVAPMIQWTDSHFRNFLRSLAAKPLLYTEMIMDTALTGQWHYRGQDLSLLRPWLVASPAEHPLAVQLGGGGIDATSPTSPAGSLPKIIGGINQESCETLAEASALVVAYNNSVSGIPLAELNINSGCPSNKALRGGFGADLMRASSQDHTRAAVSAVVRQVGSSTNVSVKCRIGVLSKGEPADSRLDYPSLCSYVAAVKAAGVSKLIVHSRICVLSGLSTGANRTVPPLKYDVVRALVRDFPDMEFVLNGGVCTLAEAESLLGITSPRQVFDRRPPPREKESPERDMVSYGFQSFDWELEGKGGRGDYFPGGCMIGRAVYNDPGLYHDADERFYGAPTNYKTWSEVLDEYFAYAAGLDSHKNNNFNSVVKPLHNVFTGQLRNREYKQALNAATREETQRVKKLEKGVVIHKGDEEILERLVRRALEGTIAKKVLDSPVRDTRPGSHYHQNVVRK